MEPERRAFLAALEENEDDLVARGVYADWLDDRGEHDEAARQRAWPEAKQWLQEFAAGLGGTATEFDWENGYHDWREITYAEVVRAGVDFAEHRDYFIQIGAEHARDEFPKHRDEFWRNWCIVTGRPRPTETDEDDGYFSDNPFSCSC